MDITDYTSYAEVRITSGLSEDELTNEDLALEIYGNALELGLGEIDLPDEAPGPGPLAERFLEIENILEANRTVAEQKLYNLTKMASAYIVSLEVVRALSMKAAKGVSDSKTTLTRFSPESVYLKVKEDIEAKLGELIESIEEINDTAVSGFTYLTVVKPDFDPVTGA